MNLNNIGIIGLGLMGGSLGLTLKKLYQNTTVLGVDNNPINCSKALELNLIDKVVNSFDDLIHCELIILTTPVNSIISIINNIKEINENCTIIDIGSTKELISNNIPSKFRKNFVLTHPMTGTEKFGPTAAVHNLYKDKTIVICDIDNSGNHQKQLINQLFNDIGMQFVFMDSKEHDEHAAFISHLPHTISFALANSVMAHEQKDSIIALASGGFKDMSRIAKSSPNMWEDIFKQNKDNIINSIDTFQNELNNCKLMIKNEEWGKLNQWMKNANDLHNIL